MLKAAFDFLMRCLSPVGYGVRLQCILLIVCGLLTEGVYSQAKAVDKIHFIRAANLEGLKVWCILKDTAGYMWFGTENGLYRYDGYNTELINSTSSKIRLSSDLVLSLFEDRQANLWIGTGNGLQQLSPDRKSIKTYLATEVIAYRRSIHAIAEMHNGNIWCGASDGYLYSSADKKSFSRIAGASVADYKNTPRLAMFITEDSSHHVWVTDNLYGFQKLTAHGQILEIFSPFNYDFHTVSFANPSTCFYANKQNVFTYSSRENKFLPEGTAALVNLLKRRVTYVYQDKKGCKWIVTQTKLIRFDPVTKQTDDLTDAFMQSGASLFQINCMYEDNNEQLWFGSYFGVYRLNNQVRIFNVISLPAGMGSNAYFSTRGVIESADSNLFIGSYSGFFKYNRVLKKFTEFKIKKNNNLVNPLARAMVSDSQGNLWLATEANGLLYFNIRSNAFTPYFDNNNADNNNAVAFTSTHNNALLKDNEGQLWLGGYHNLYHFNTRNQIASMFTTGEGRKDLSLLKVMVIYQSRDSSLWVGTDYGLYHITKEKVLYAPARIIDAHLLKSNFINCIYEDNNGLLWIGTNGNGIHVLNPVNRQVEKVYTELEGLADNRVCAILPGKENDVWISTYNGLSRLNVKSKLFRNFYETDGMPVNEFNQGSSLAGSDGTLYFGSMNGIVYFKPDINLPPVKQPQVMLTKLVKHNGKENKIEETTLHISAIKNITLDYNDRFFTVYFTLKDHFESADSHCQFAYKLDGVIDEWQNIGGNNYIQLAGLPAGNYLLRIKGMGSDGVWSKTELQLPVLVAAAFYATKGAYLFYVVVLLIIITLIFRFRLKQGQAAKRITVRTFAKRKTAGARPGKIKLFQ